MAYTTSQSHTELEVCKRRLLVHYRIISHQIMNLSLKPELLSESLPGPPPPDTLPPLSSHGTTVLACGWPFQALP